MTLDAPQQQRFGPVMNFDYPTHGQPPAFSNPWSSSPSPSQTAAVAGSNLYVGGPQPPSLNHNLMHKSHSARAPTSSAPPLSSYASMPVHTTAAGTFCVSHSLFHCDAVNHFSCSPNLVFRFTQPEPPADLVCCLCRRHLRHDGLSRPRSLCAPLSYSLRCLGVRTSSCAAACV
jgi:hypothetical protein